MRIRRITKGSTKAVMVSSPSSNQASTWDRGQVTVVTPVSPNSRNSRNSQNSHKNPPKNPVEIGRNLGKIRQNWSKLVKIHPKDPPGDKFGEKNVTCVIEFPKFPKFPQKSPKKSG
ncbi:hypothetical protein HGM15179_021898 [Zosterops borbonicus]|uniref:Uncharacterized protein n=1 Tax=Zosterops borbonicus TaxID=364589 RepID=A0A8K1D4Y8_9PASS|nr:hypothetical protein HGM15179_021898 [Zosterops borbonicus]